jgi:hypothetical protein
LSNYYNRHEFPRMTDRTLDIFRSLNAGTKFNRKRFAEDISLFENRNKEEADDDNDNDNGEEGKIRNSNLSDPLNFFGPFTKSLTKEATIGRDTIQGKLISEKQDDRKMASKSSSDPDDKANIKDRILNSFESIEKVELSRNKGFREWILGRGC